MSETDPKERMLDLVPGILRDASAALDMAEKFRLELIRASFLYVRRPDLFSAEDLARFFTKEEVEWLGAYRLGDYFIDVASYADYKKTFDQGKRGRKSKPPRRNPKLDEYVKSKTGTAGEILAALELMDRRQRQKAIGQTKIPGRTTIKDAKKRAT